MMAKIWNFNEWITETDPKTLFARFDSLLRDAGFHVLRCIDYYFSPQGYTCLFLLGESHFAIHTFPEEGKTYIELSSCNKEYYERFVAMCGGG